MAVAVDPASPKRRLTRDDWAEAALTAIAEGGLPAVAVEPLAARLGTTKGSFYWHFTNREALLEAALTRWEERTTTEVIAQIDRAPKDPADRLRLLIVTVIEMAERDPVGPALLANAHHPLVAPLLARVTKARLGIITRLFGQLGFPAAEARSRALLAYSAYLGHAQLAHSTPDLLPRTRKQRREYLDRTLSTLTGKPAQVESPSPTEPPSGPAGSPAFG